MIQPGPAADPRCRRVCAHSRAPATVVVLGRLDILDGRGTPLLRPTPKGLAGERREPPCVHVSRAGSSAGRCAPAFHAGNPPTCRELPR